MPVPLLVWQRYWLEEFPRPLKVTCHSSGLPPSDTRSNRREFLCHSDLLLSPRRWLALTSSEGAHHAGHTSALPSPHRIFTAISFDPPPDFLEAANLDFFLDSLDVESQRMLDCLVVEPCMVPITCAAPIKAE